MNEKSDKILDILQGFKSLENSILPSGKFSWRVNVVRLLVSREMLLGDGVELHHGSCEGVSMILQGVNLL